MSKIDGKIIAQEFRDELKVEIERDNLTPCLAVVLVGERKDSQTYVRMKIKACKEAGIESVDTYLSDTVSEDELLQVVQDLNADPKVNGILVQLPLPKHINQHTILDAISPIKDVDGLTPYNQGLLLSRDRQPYHYPCTPYGCMILLEKTLGSRSALSGKKAVVLGRSPLVGLPMFHLLTKADCTVTLCHRRTQNTEKYLKEAEIVVVAIGRASHVKKTWLNPNAIVIDVGINSVDDSTRKAGYRLVGDVEKEALTEGHVKAMTPVPGGVGPMTIAMLLGNTVKAYRLQHKID